MRENSASLCVCGYDLRDLKGTRCPECGEGVEVARQMQTANAATRTLGNQLVLVMLYLMLPGLAFALAAVMEVGVNRRRSIDAISQAIVLLPMYGMLCFGLWRASRDLLKGREPLSLLLLAWLASPLSLFVVLPM